jgi:hypothetical protein
VPNLYNGDSVNITVLVNSGIKIVHGKVIAWFPEDSFTVDRMNEIVVMMDRGISGAEKFIGAPLQWQVHQPNQPYTFYFRTDRFISHASLAGFVSIPFWRIKDDKAPWLHEAIHEMLYTKNGSWWDKGVVEEDYSKNMPLWLFEGFPDYISQTVSAEEQLPWFDVFFNSTKMNSDSLFVAGMRLDKAKYILSFIGVKGHMPELFGNDRVLYAPLFYHGSCSFVKWLAGRYGVKILLTAVSSFRKEQETIEQIAGKPIDALKKEWLDHLKIAN